MSNRFGIPRDIELEIRARDRRCVYCRRRFSRALRTTMATIEHLNEKPPFHWHQGLNEGGLAICCGSCNSSRGRKTLRDWFESPYCGRRNIRATTVAAPVKRYLKGLRRHK